ncbi:MAG: hypothetical protein RIR43_1325 [Pseudomonadota bacterium]
MAAQPAVHRVFLLGATGTIGLATARALSRAGHSVVCLVRPRRSGHPSGPDTPDGLRALQGLPGLELRFGDPTQGLSLRRDGLRGEHFDSWVSCLASRTGAARDAWAVDHGAHLEALKACQEAGVRQVVQLSAICVQKPELEFQKAKLAFEQTLMQSGLNYSIVRPTAFFKSLSGQFQRVKSGKPYLLFGDGERTACKPIADQDLGDFLASCLQDRSLQRAVLPIGGPGPALTPREQGLLLFEALGKKPHFRHVPLALMDAVVGGLSWLGRWSSTAAEKAEFARIGRYYARESMLVWNADRRCYSEQDTPSYGDRTLLDHYRAMARGEVQDQRGDHAVF